MSKETFIFLFVILTVLHPPLFASERDCPSSIVSVTLASDEIIIDIVSDRDRIAGVTYLTDDRSISNVADRVADIPKIHANLEQIVEIEPDLVIVSGFLSNDFISLVNAAGLNTLLLKDVRSIADIRKNILMIGEAVCEEEAAEKLVSEMEEKIDSIRRNVDSHHEHRRVLFYSAPGFTAAGNSTVDEIITLAGGKNVFGDERNFQTSRISLEYIVETDPDIIILSSFAPSNQDFAKEFAGNEAIRETSAYKNDRIHVIEGRYIVSSSHYIVNAVRELAGIINNSTQRQ